MFNRLTVHLTPVVSVEPAVVVPTVIAISTVAVITMVVGYVTSASIKSDAYVVEPYGEVDAVTVASIVRLSGSGCERPDHHCANA
jgi:hypothetical protein